jgi:cobalt-zinc-cadmium efflux system membrane fusion protein
MDLRKKYYPFFFILLLFVVTNFSYAAEEEHEEGHEEENVLVLTAEERKKSGLKIEKVEYKSLSEQLSSPGEVIVNAYASAKVAPRVAAQVVTRHVKLGEKVNKGQVLVTLSSVEVAKAQGELLIASAEWNRVKKLGREAVSGRRYTEARIAQQQAIGKVTAYGMTQSQIDALLKNIDASKANGMFDLLSPQEGIIITDNFIVGEQIEPGRVLFDISDESKLWVEARTIPEKTFQISEGTAARVSRDGLQWIEGTVIQVHHQLDETTRTQGIRIEVENTNDLLHPGEFVKTKISVGAESKVLAVPTSALFLLESHQSIFKLEGDELHPEPIVTGATVGNWTEVREGLSEGDEVVIEGTFVLKSLLLKSELGEGHGH